MSYILEALRKADAERERGQVPGIHAQTLAPASADAERPARRLLRASLALSAGLLVLLALLGWYSFGRQPVTASGPQQIPAPRTAVAAATPGTAAPGVPAAPAEHAAPVQPAAPAPVPAPAPPAATTPAPPVAAVAQKHAHTRSEPKPEAVKPSAKTETRLAKAAAPSKRTLPGTHAADAGHEPKPSEKAAKTAKTAGDEAPRIHALSELPAEIRQQIPPLTIGGASYSSNPSSRMLIVNGQVFHENDRLTPDLQLQQIRLKSAVLDFKGHRYEIKY